MFCSEIWGIYLAAKILCFSAILLGATVGACWPIADKNAVAGAQSAASPTADLGVADVALEIAINRFPAGYQGRWAISAIACDQDPDSSAEIMSLQGRLIKLAGSIATMVQGKRMTSKTMAAEFQFVDKTNKSTRMMAFKLSEDRAQIVRTDKADGLRTRYVRCPKLMSG